jgi:PEGA domain
MKRTLVLALILAAAPAHADNTEAEKLAAQGEELAKTGEYTRAIDSFKAADKLDKRARHACMIGLAYLRRELWPQAELFFETCKLRASLNDPLPDWFQDAMTQLGEKLASTTVSAVTIKVAPEGSLAQINVSSFAPDETFSPRTIHLAPGKHTIEVNAPGYPARSETFTVEPSKALIIEVTLKHAVKRYVTPRASKVPFVIMGGGILVGLVGVGYHLGAYSPLRSDVAEVRDPNEYGRLADKLRDRRAINIALYGVGAVAIATGLVLRKTVFKRTPVLVGAEPTEGGGVVSLSWQR